MTLFSYAYHLYFFWINFLSYIFSFFKGKFGLKVCLLRQHRKRRNVNFHGTFDNMSFWNYMLTSWCTLSNYVFLVAYVYFRQKLRERPLMTSEDFRRFLTYLPFSTLKRPIFGSFWTPQPTLKSDVNNGRSLSMYLLL